jgi:transmembrane sensor
MKENEDNKKNIDIQILMRYLEGNGSNEDICIVKQWFTNIGSEHELHEKCHQFWDGISLEPNIKGYNEAHILDHIYHKIKIEEAVFLNITKPKLRFINYLTKIAAILFIPVLAASLLYHFQNNSIRNVVSFYEIHAPIGTRTNFYLPDGSRGWLNGGSSLKVPTQFRGKIRNVKLTGEAYFNVISNHKIPFVVTTENIDVKAFGTSFNVMAYADEQITEVTLASGQVEVFKKTNKIIKSLGTLKPKETCTYNFQSGTSKILSTNSTDKLSWLDGKLTFKYEPFEEVVHKINRWYNVNIVIKDELLETYIYYGTFKDETLEQVLRLLQFTAPIKYREIKTERKQDGTFEKRKIEMYYKKIR